MSMPRAQVLKLNYLMAGNVVISSLLISKMSYAQGVYYIGSDLFNK